MHNPVGTGLPDCPFVPQFAFVADRRGRRSLRHVVCANISLNPNFSAIYKHRRGGVSPPVVSQQVFVADSPEACPYDTRFVRAHLQPPICGRPSNPVGATIGRLFFQQNSSRGRAMRAPTLNGANTPLNLNFSATHKPVGEGFPLPSYRNRSLSRTVRRPVPTARGLCEHIDIPQIFGNAQARRGDMPQAGGRPFLGKILFTDAQCAPLR